MVRKRKKKEDEQPPWCYYCDRVFSDEQTLVQHQKAKHFKVRFLTASCLSKPYSYDSASPLAGLHATWQHMQPPCLQAVMEGLLCSAPLVTRD